MADRTAINTIRGYFYQFDFTIAKLLELQEEADTIIVEGVEDVDVNTATEEVAIQCKYYAKTEYNHSVISKPIRLMLDHYKEVTRGNKQRIYYKLYGNFGSGQNKLVLPLNSTYLKENFLTYVEKKIRYCHHTELDLNDTELDDFLSLLSIDILALEYQAQLLQITSLLMQQLSCNIFEAEHFFYNNALKVIKNLAVEENEAKRKISKANFLNQINFKSILFNQWFISYKGEAKFFADLRNQYFSSLHISARERFFLIEVPSVNYRRPELKDLLFTISRKWSKLTVREPEPFCPYVYLHNLHERELLELKKEINLEGFKFIDGFDFNGASYSAKSISKSLNKNNSVRLKIIDELGHIDLTVNEINKTKEIYQFYSSSSFFNSEYANIKHVRIQFSKLSDIIKII